MIYTALCIMFLMCAYPLLGQEGGGLGPGNLEFVGPQMALAYRAQPPPTCPRNLYAHLQNIMQGAG
jgi:hypothetical protein